MVNGSDILMALEKPDNIHENVQSIEPWLICHLSRIEKKIVATFSSASSGTHFFLQREFSEFTPQMLILEPS